MHTMARQGLTRSVADLGGAGKLLGRGPPQQSPFRTERIDLLACGSLATT